MHMHHAEAQSRGQCTEDCLQCQMVRLMAMHNSTEPVKGLFVMLSVAKQDKRNTMAVCTEQCLQGWTIRLEATHDSTDTTDNLDCDLVSGQTR